jgi:hypothetical protein
MPWLPTVFERMPASPHWYSRPGVLCTIQTAVWPRPPRNFPKPPEFGSTFRPRKRIG